jgi:hypothetical protein
MRFHVEQPDIVQQLREPIGLDYEAVMHQAADIIEALRQQIYEERSGL